MAQAINSYTTSRFPNFSNEALADGGGGLGLTSVAGLGLWRRGVADWLEVWRCAAAFD